MLLEAQSKTEVQGLSSTSFQIKATSKAFQILTANLYSYKERSVVRELCANALDSHVQAGKADIPFKVTLPSKLDPNLIVEDFGIGLSKEEAVKLFSTIFESTKDQSNDQVGAFGLGSKSPFAIADSFGATCIKDGKKSQILIFRGDDGTPQISVVLEKETTEPNGVKISVPIEYSNIYNFNEEAKYSLFSFYPKPICNQEFKSLFDKTDDIIEYENCYVFSNTDYLLSSGTVYVLNGPALYQVEPSLKRNHDIDFYGPHVVILKSKIGDVDIPPSRETLDLTNKTKTFINEKLNSVKTEADLEFMNFIKNSDKKSNLSKVRYIKSNNFLLKSINRNLNLIGYALTDKKLKKSIDEELAKISESFFKGGFLRKAKNVNITLLNMFLESKNIIIDNTAQSAIKSQRLIDAYKLLLCKKENLKSSSKIEFLFQSHIFDSKNKQSKAEYVKFKNKQVDNVQKCLDRYFDEGDIKLVKFSDLKEYQKSIAEPKVKKENPVVQFKCYSSGRNTLGSTKFSFDHSYSESYFNETYYVEDNSKYENTFLSIVAEYKKVSIIISKNSKQQRFIQEKGIEHLDFYLVKLIDEIDSEYTKKYLFNMLELKSYKGLCLSGILEQSVNTDNIRMLVNFDMDINDLGWSETYFLKVYHKNVNNSFILNHLNIDLNELNQRKVFIDRIEFNYAKIREISDMFESIKSIQSVLNSSYLVDAIKVEINKAYLSAITLLNNLIGDKNESK